MIRTNKTANENVTAELLECPCTWAFNGQKNVVTYAPINPCQEYSFGIFIVAMLDKRQN